MKKAQLHLISLFILETWKTITITKKSTIKLFDKETRCCVFEKKNKSRTKSSIGKRKEERSEKVEIFFVFAVVF